LIFTENLKNLILYLKNIILKLYHSNMMTWINGEIIDQGKPEDLIAKHGRTNLEEVFLKLSRSKSEFN